MVAEKLHSSATNLQTLSKGICLYKMWNSLSVADAQASHWLAATAGEVMIWLGGLKASS